MRSLFSKSNSPAGGAVASCSVLLIALGCSSAKDAPPYWQGTPGSAGPSNPGGALGGARSGDGGTQGSGGTSSGTGGAAATPSGQLALRAFDGAFELDARDLKESGTIFVKNDADESWTPTDYKGSPIPFSPPSEAPVWGAFIPPNVDNYFITLSQVSSASPTLGVVSLRTMEDIFEFLAVPDDPNLSRAQLLVRVVDAGGVPLAGVRPEVPDAEAFLFASVGTWVDSDQTSNEGMFLATNVTAPSFPGTLTLVTLTGALEGTYLLPVVTSGVTVVTIAAE